MNKLESFAIHSGLKINKPVIDESFFPIVHEKYISFNLEEKEKSKAYDYWQEVLDLIFPALSENNIKVIQIGGSKAPQIDGVFSLKGMLNFNQESYVIRHSMLHLNAFDYRSSLSSFNETNCISLISHENPSDLISSDFLEVITPDDQLFSQNPNEQQKTINKIKPIKIANAILKKLSINSLFNFDQVFLGKNYSIKTIEIIPDFFPQQSFLTNSLLNLRADLHFDLQKIHAFAQNRKLGIITDRVFDEGFINSIRTSIQKISLEVSSVIDTDASEVLNFLKILKKYKIPFELFTRDESLLKDLRLRFIDERVSFFETKQKKDLDKDVKLCDNLFMKSSKIIISNGQKYPSKAHWIVNQPMKKDGDSVIDTSDFWEDQDYYIIYRKDS